MRRLLLVVSSCLSLSSTCIGQQKKGDGLVTEIGLDIGAVICRKELCLTVGREFAPHWSLEGYHTFVFGRLTKGRNEEEEMHDSILSTEDLSSVEISDDLISGGLRVRYWIKETYKGGYFMAGCRLGDRKGVDGTIGLGYSIQIWNGMRCSISYDIDLRRSSLHKSPKGNGLGITISYTY